MTRRILIDPVTRLEGHGRIDIRLDEAGNVSHAFFRYRISKGSSSSAWDGPLKKCPP